MKRSTKKLLTRLLPVIALFLAINIGFGIEYYLRIPKDWYTVSAAGQYNATSQGFAIDTSEKIAYVTSGEELLILDYTNLTSPSLLSSYNKSTVTLDVAIDGDIAVVTSAKNISIIDISNPASPIGLSNFSIHEDYTIRDVDIKGDMVYLAVRADFLSPEPGLYNRILYVVNITNPSAPTEAATLRRFGTYGDELFIYGDILYISQEDWGTVLIDISEPGSPSLYSGYYSLFGLVSDYPGDVNVQKTEVRSIDGSTYIFVADLENGYIIGDVTNTEDPQPINGVFLGDVVSLHLTSNLAFVLRSTGQTLVYSLKKPTKFNIVGKFDPYTETLIAKDIYVHQATSTVFILRNNGLALYYLREGVKNDYYREEISFSYTWIAIGLSLLICVPMFISVVIRHKETYAYSSKF
jgi:hypothetical protein